MSRRTEQAASSIQRAVQAVISRGLSDPRVSGLISVTEVRVSPDGATAYISVSVMPEEKEDLTLHGLRHAAAHIRRQVGDMINTRRMPELEFRIDKSFKKQAQVLEALAQVQAEREAHAPTPPPTAAPEQET